MTNGSPGSMAWEVLRHNGLQVPYPPGWEDVTQVVLVAGVDGSFRPNLVVSHDPAAGAKTAAEFAARHLDMLREALEEYRVVSEKEHRLGPHNGYLRTHDFSANGQRLRQIQYYLIAEEIAYTFTFTHLADRFANQVEWAFAMIKGTEVSAPSRAAARVIADTLD